MEVLFSDNYDYIIDACDTTKVKAESLTKLNVFILFDIPETITYRVKINANIIPNTTAILFTIFYLLSSKLLVIFQIHLLCPLVIVIEDIAGVRRDIYTNNF